MIFHEDSYYFFVKLFDEWTALLKVLHINKNYIFYYREKYNKIVIYNIFFA